MTDLQSFMLAFDSVMIVVIYVIVLLLWMR